ncbi:MAG: carbohydrate-binding family 9-like protein [Clostridia bacterium]|nr:carbohydrate-binding family 9-like protein [Clostridia bacterium]
MMKEYVVKKVDNLVWADIPKAEISTYKWVEGYAPRAFAQIAYLKGRGLAVKMTAFEADPLATHHNFNDPVYEDSCLEAFLMLDPVGKKYVNFEMNSLGTFLSTLREADGNIVTIDNFIDLPKIKANREEENWSVEFILSDSDIKKLFPSVVLESGSVFSANFYKCGDKTAIPHYGMWNEIGGTKISYHQPEYFGKLIIE